MKETKIYSGPLLISASDIYEHTMKQLIIDTFDKYTKEAVLKLLEDIEWIEPLLQSVFQADRIKLYYSNLNDMKCGLYPNPLAWSAMYYHLSLLSINTHEMRITINTSRVLKNELKNSDLWKSIWN